MGRRSVSPPHEVLYELAAMREMAQPPDVEAAFDSALEHRMSGLLWTACEGFPTVGPRWPELMATYLQHQARSERLTRVLGDVTRRLGGLGIEVVAVKGVTAESRWYGTAGERPCWDIDLLVAPHDFHRVCEIIAALDPAHQYLRNATPRSLGRLVSRGTIQSIDIRFDGVAIDLHFDLFKLGIASRHRELIWDRSVRHALDATTEVRVLDPEIALVHFLVHLNKDSFHRMLGYADVARVLREHLDWAFIEVFVRHEGLEVPTWMTLDAVTDTLGLRNPGPDAPGGWRTPVWRIAWRPGVRLRGNPDVADVAHPRHRTDLVGFLVRGRLGRAARGWARHFVLPPDVQVREWYPTAQGPYLWRLVSGRMHGLRQGGRGRPGPAPGEVDARADAPMIPARRRQATRSPSSPHRLSRSRPARRR